MTDLFTKKEVIIFKIINWVITIIVGFIPIWLFYKSKKEAKKLEERLEKEIIARKDSEKKILEKNIEEWKSSTKAWKSLYSHEKESKERYYKQLEEAQEENSKLREEMWEKETKHSEEIRRLGNEWGEEVWSLRKQLSKVGIPLDKHDVSDERQKEEAIWSVEPHWRFFQDKNGKINGRTITEVLGENWRNIFNNKEGEDIIKTRDWLIKKIDDEAKLKKLISN